MPTLYTIRDASTNLFWFAGSWQEEPEFLSYAAAKNVIDSSANPTDGSWELNKHEFSPSDAGLI